MNQIIIASGNDHKIEEILKISRINSFKGELLTKDNYNIPDTEENGSSFADNAIIKAKAVYDLYKIPVISDDSGLCVQSLGGFPGIYSSRYSGQGTSGNIQKMLLEMKNIPLEKRNAFFNCTVCLYIDHNTQFLFSGQVHGYIQEKLEGENGFGYDPIFFLKEYNCTIAQISSEEKNRISHRGKAFTRTFQFLSNYLTEHV